MVSRARYGRVQHTVCCVTADVWFWSLTKEAAAKVIRTAYDCGVNFYDHATCYGRDGEAEKRFATKAYSVPSLRLV